MEFIAIPVRILDARVHVPAVFMRLYQIGAGLRQAGLQLLDCTDDLRVERLQLRAQRKGLRKHSGVARAKQLA